MRHARESETAVAGRVRDHLVDAGWDVYCEVKRPTGHRADLVAVHGQVTMVVEVKTSWSLALLAQARNWKPYAHRVYAAAPSLPLHRQAIKSLATAWGIGMICVAEFDSEASAKVVLVAPVCRRPPLLPTLRDALDERQKTEADPGSQHGFWSPWRGTCRTLAEWVHANPGRPFPEAMRAIKTHYACADTARSAMRRWIVHDKVPGVLLKRQGRKLYLYPAEGKIP